MDDLRYKTMWVSATVSSSAKRLLAVLLSLLLLFILPPTSVWAQASCVFYSDYNSVAYMRFPSSNFVSGVFMLYRDDACQGQPSSGLNTGPLGYVHSPSQQGAAIICANVHSREMEAYRDFTKYSSQVIWWCLDPAADPPSGGGDSRNPSGSGPSGSGPGADGDTDASAPGPHSCETLVQTSNLKMSATYGLTSGIQCRRIGADGVVNAAIKSQSAQDAVDVFGYAEQGYQLCFPRTGTIIFLDAATAPRSVVTVDYSHSGGFTCASLNRAGTVVLVGAGPGAATTGSQPTSAKAPGATKYIRPGTYDLLSSAISLRDCTVTPSTTLRFRAGPWGRLLGRVWESSAAPASARTRSWYKISYKGQEGWIAAWLTTAAGSCFGAGPGHAALPLVTLPGTYTALLTGS